MAEENEQNKQEEKAIPSLAELYDKIKIENDRAEAILKRNEELAARNLLGGKSDAGVEPVKKEETPTEYKQRVMSGQIKFT